jgi:hypothetical protein
MQLVYEDSDEEEMTANEVLRNLWESSVPTNKMNQCKRHAERAGFSLEPQSASSSSSSSSSAAAVTSSSTSMGGQDGNESEDEDEHNEDEADGDDDEEDEDGRSPKRSRTHESDTGAASAASAARENSPSTANKSDTMHRSPQFSGGNSSGGEVNGVDNGHVNGHKASNGDNSNVAYWADDIRHGGDGARSGDVVRLDQTGARAEREVVAVGSKRERPIRL